MAIPTAQERRWMVNPGNRICVKEKVPLGSMTTFKIGGPTRYFFVAKTDEELIYVLELAKAACVPTFILGGGSNVLVNDAGFDGITLKVETKGIEILDHDRDSVRLRVSAGENWDEVVRMSVERGWWGIENMSCIPGTAGALPIQNVGAYGQEASDVIEYVEVWDSVSSSTKTLDNSACSFSYRKSSFNSGSAGRYVVLSIVLRLHRRGVPNLTHSSCRHWIKVHQRGILNRVRRALRRGIPPIREIPLIGEPQPTLRCMRECIVSLRGDGRLPDPDVMGNAGSFFKSVLITEEECSALLGIVSGRVRDQLAPRLKTVVVHKGGATRIKIGAGALIEAFGLVGTFVGGASLYSRNSVVLVNASGNATARDVMLLAKHIRTVIFEQTGLVLEIEPNLVGLSADERRFYLDLHG
jgi:UDP-N-acetylmuramate dehydrogenase